MMMISVRCYFIVGRKAKQLLHSRCIKLFSSPLFEKMPFFSCATLFRRMCITCSLHLVIVSLPSLAYSLSLYCLIAFHAEIN